MKKRLCCLLLCAGLLGLCGCAAVTGMFKKPLRVGVRADIADFGFQSPDSGRFYGLEIDIAEEMARRMGYSEAVFVAVTPETRETVLESGEADCLLACYTITDERREKFDFSEPYYYDNLVAVVETSTGFTRLVDLGDQLIGVLEGTTAGELFSRCMEDMGCVPGNGNGEGYRLYNVGSYDQLSELLECGTVDAICLDGSIAKEYLRSEGVTGDRARFPIIATRQAYGVATVKGSSLSAAVDETIRAMLADGTIDQYIEKWN